MRPPAEILTFGVVFIFHEGVSANGIDIVRRKKPYSKGDEYRQTLRHGVVVGRCGRRCSEDKQCVQPVVPALAGTGHNARTILLDAATGDIARIEIFAGQILDDIRPILLWLVRGSTIHIRRWM